MKKIVTDDNDYYTYELSNKMRIFNIINKNIKHVYVALVVKVGYMHDTNDGIAHLIEHLIYGEDFLEYIHENDGTTNAYTACNHTCYFYKINKDKANESIVKFSEYFVKPLFKEVEKEITIVDSEHEKNKKDDRWRINEIIKKLFYSDHGASRFGTGTKDTLKDCDVNRFFNNYYSSDLMTLFIISNERNDDIIRKSFNKFSIKDKISLNEMRYKGDVIKNGTIYYSSVCNRNILCIFIDVKNGSFLRYLLNNESHGTVNEFLKRNNLCYNIEIDVNTFTDDREIIELKYELFDVSKIDYVISLIMGYLKFISNADITELCNEYVNIKTINKMYMDIDDVGNSLLNYVEKWMIYKPDPEDLIVSDIVCDMKFEINGMIIVKSGRNYDTKRKLEHYDAMYEIVDEKYDEYKWDSMPSMNRYISDIYCRNNKSENIICLSENCFCKKENVMSSGVIIKLYVPFIMDIEKYVSLELYIGDILYSLFSDIYELQVLGNIFSIKMNYNHIKIIFYGFNISKFIDLIINRILSFDISNLDQVKFLFKKEMENEIFKTPFNQIDDKFLKYGSSIYFEKDDKILITEKLSKVDIIKNVRKIFSLTTYYLLLCGNVSDNDIENINNSISLFRMNYKPVIYDYVNPKFEKIFENSLNIEENNSVIGCYYIIGKSVFNGYLECLTRVIEILLYSQYFEYMRNIKNYGYVVQAECIKFGDKAYGLKCIKFIVQTSKDKLEEICNSVKEFCKVFMKYLKSLSDEHIQSICHKLARIMEEPFENLVEKIDYYYENIDNYRFTFDMKDEIIKGYKKISKSDVINFCHKYLIKNKNICVLGIKK